MKKLIIICEGPTEQLFCKDILEDHFKGYNIEIEYPLIIHSGGGIVKWEHLKNQILNHHTADNDSYITTFIDYYGLEGHHNFPEWNRSELETNKTLRMNILEQGMKEDLPIEIKFIPYVQLHEFESLVFSDYEIFEEYYESSEADFNALKNIFDNYPNPEDINNQKLTAPSKRLIAHIPRYLKKIDGIEILKLVGIPTIRAKCVRFNQWLDNLEKI